MAPRSHRDAFHRKRGKFKPLAVGPANRPKNGKTGGIAARIARRPDRAWSNRRRGINHACDANWRYCRISGRSRVLYGIDALRFGQCRWKTTRLDPFQEFVVLENLMGGGQSAANGRDKVGLGSIRRPVIGLALGG